jgi:hypothetical protein
MKEGERHFNPEINEGGVVDIEDALMKSDLDQVEAPRKGTKAYDRLIAAAENYMAAVKAQERSQPPRSDSEDYFAAMRRKSSSSSDTERRQYHDELAMMLLGNRRKGMAKEDANKLSNFAAYVTGNEEYIDRW